MHSFEFAPGGERQSYEEQGMQSGRISARRRKGMQGNRITPPQFEGACNELTCAAGPDGQVISPCNTKVLSIDRGCEV